MCESRGTSDGNDVSHDDLRAPFQGKEALLDKYSLLEQLGKGDGMLTTPLADSAKPNKRARWIASTTRLATALVLRVIANSDTPITERQPPHHVTVVELRREHRHDAMRGWNGIRAVPRHAPGRVQPPKEF